MCQSAYRSSDSQVKLRVGPPKFRLWPGYRVPTPVIYSGSEPLHLHIACQSAYRSSDPQLKLRAGPPQVQVLAWLSRPIPLQFTVDLNRYTCKVRVEVLTEVQIPM